MPESVSEQVVDQKPGTPEPEPKVASALELQDQLDETLVPLGLGLSEDKNIKLCFDLVSKQLSRLEGGKVVWEKRRNGELALSHPVAVAIGAVEMALKHPDMVPREKLPLLVQAALMHDFFEDTAGGAAIFSAQAEYADSHLDQVMEQAYDVTLPKMSQLNDETSDRYGHTIENKKRKLADQWLYEHISREARGKNESRKSNFLPLFIKLSDLLHNYRTLSGLKPARRVEFVEFAQARYIPLARDVGLGDVASELELEGRAALGINRASLPS